MLVAAAIWFSLAAGLGLGLLSHPKIYAAMTGRPVRSADHEGW